MLFALAGIAGAQVKVGVIVSATGPAASLGIPEKNTVGLCSKSMGGKTVEYILLDEASDTTTAVQNAKKVIGEDKVDAIIGTTTTPTTLAILDVIADGETPTISLASSIRIIEPMDAKRAWMFKTPQTDVMMAGAILEHMAKNGVKTIGYVGFNDALGEAFFAEIDKAAKARNIPLVANERFAPKDTSVVGQALKLHGRQARRHRDRRVGHAGRAAGAHARRAGLQGQALLQPRRGQQRFPARRRQGRRGRLRADQPGDRRRRSCPTAIRRRSRRLEYIKVYEAAFGPGSVSAFGSYTWDACLELANAIPQALKTAQPGTKEFRRALRDALEATKDLHVTNGVVNMSKTDHLGLDARARVMVQIKDGKWVLQN